MNEYINVYGAGLAGCEAAWQIAKRGIKVRLYEMKPEKNDSNFGVQAGLVNYSEGKGIQFGLWNTNPNGFLKHFPLINISW